MFSSTLFHAFLSGCFAAVASLFGKMSFSDDDIVGKLTNYEVLRHMLLSIDLQFPVIYCIRAMLIGLLLLSNVLMWLFLSKAMSSSESTVQVLAINNATNFLLSAVIGVVYFGEYLSRLSCIGIVSMLVGVTLIHLDSQYKEKLKTP